MLQKRVGLYQDREATQTGKMSGCVKIQRRDTNKVGEIEVTVLQSYTHKQKEQIKRREKTASSGGFDQGRDRSAPAGLLQSKMSASVMMMMF